MYLHDHLTPNFIFCFLYYDFLFHVFTCTSTCIFAVENVVHELKVKSAMNTLRLFAVQE